MTATFSKLFPYHSFAKLITPKNCNFAIYQQRNRSLTSVLQLSHYHNNPLPLHNFCSKLFHSLFSSSLLIIIMGKTNGGFYAVARGKKVGVYMTWNECKEQVNGFSNARYKKFDSQSEADQFIFDNSGAAAESSNFHRTISSRTIDGGVRKPKTTNIGSNSCISTNISQIPQSSYTVSLLPPSSSSSLFQSLPNNSVPSRRQQTRTTILLSQPPPVSSSISSKRGLSTTAKLDKRALRVTEDRVTGIKKLESNVGVDLSKFDVDDDGYVVVFTDGACTKNGRKGAKAGIGVWFGDNHNLNISEPVLGRQTNNTAEIQAAERAILGAKNAGINKLKLKTDSQFTINCVTMWLNKWKRNNWKLGTGKDVKNREDLEKLDQAMNGIEIKWSYVAGHRGHYGNEQADQLAVAGANK